LRSNKKTTREAIGIWRAARQRAGRKSGRKEGCTVVPATRKVLSTTQLEIPFLRALVCGRTDYGQEVTAPFLASVAECVDFLLKAPKIDPAVIRQEWPRKGSEAIVKAATSRRFASTDAGLVGYVPERARKGDLVVIFYGASVPFVVRREPGGMGRYSLVGECYMDGVMSGAGMTMVNMEKPEREFALV
jgi:hypothetical protein